MYIVQVYCLFTPLFELAFMNIDVLVKNFFSPWLILLPSDSATDKHHIMGSARSEGYYKIDETKKIDYLENITPPVPPSTKEVISLYLL